jgi:RNA polymerase sigma factor (sigma-70 family)
VAKQEDTGIGGSATRFPTTKYSAVDGARSKDAGERTRAFETIVASYWKPVYKYIRLKWHKSNEDAKDLTQHFFAICMEKDYFHRYDSTKARFRTFLRTCLDGFLANEEKAAKRLKRGGQKNLLSLDYESAEGELKQIEIPANESMDDFFEKEWIRNFFSSALEALRAECEKKGKNLHFKLFEEYYLDESSYEDLAARLSLSISNVTNYLAFTRREFRRIILEKLRENTSTEEEFRSEAKSLLGIEIE